MTLEELTQLNEHLKRIEPMVKKFAQLRGYTTMIFPPMASSGEIRLLKMENGFNYCIILRRESSLEGKRYNSFFEEMPYFLTAYIKGTKNNKSFELYKNKPFNQIAESMLDDLFQCDYRLEEHKEKTTIGPIEIPSDFQKNSDAYRAFKDLNLIIDKFSEKFEYEYDYDPLDGDILKIRFFKEVNGVLFNIILRPDIGVGDYFSFSDNELYTLRCSISSYKLVNKNVLAYPYLDSIFYEKRRYMEIKKSLYEDLIYCDKYLCK